MPFVVSLIRPSAIVLAAFILPASDVLAQTAVVLPQIEVVGEKRARDPQDSQSSVGVVTRETIEATRPMTDVYDATRFMGNVLGPMAANLGVTIRGVDADGGAIGAMQSVTGARSRVSVLVDGVPQTFNSAYRGGIPSFGVRQMEVYRGSQSTLQGRNAIGGAIIVETLAPSFSWEGLAEGRSGRFGYNSLSGTMSGPVVSDQLAVRVTAEGYDRDSDISYTNSAVRAADPSPTREERRSFSGKALIRPKWIPDLDLTIGYRNSNESRSQWNVVDLNGTGRIYSGTTYAGVFTVNPQSLFANGEYRISDVLSLASTNSVSKFDETLRERAGNSADFVYDTLQLATEQRLVLGGPGARARGVVGVSYLKGDRDERVRRPFTMDVKDTVETLSAFAEGELRVLPRLDLIAGARAERETQHRRGRRTFSGAVDIDTSVESTALLPKGGARFHVDESVSVGASVRKGYSAAGAGSTLQNGSPFSYSKEESWTYEADLRTSWYGERLRVNANIFRTDHRNMQVGDNNGFQTRIVNVPRARSAGAEIDFRALPLGGLEVFGSVGLLSARFDDYLLGSSQLAGNSFARAPELTGSLAAIYRHESGWFASADGQFVGGYFSDIQNTRADRVGSRFIVNAQTGYEWGAVTAFLFADNALDNAAKTYVWTSQGVKALVPPATYGLGMRVRF